MAAIAILSSLARQEGSEFVFPAERGDGHYQGTKGVWSKALKKAGLPGITPHTLRHTMGSTAVSTGEALALTGAILGHSNPRSTAIYAHVQNDPSKRAADRVSKKIAAALVGNPSEKVQWKPGTSHRNSSDAADEVLKGQVCIRGRSVKSGVLQNPQSSIICSCCRTKSEFGISGSDAARSMARKLQIVVLDVRFVRRRVDQDRTNGPR
jgi:hypothetical protein